MRRIFLIFMAFSILVWASHSGAEVVNRIVAVVNDDVITYFELDRESRDAVNRAVARNQSGSNNEVTYNTKRQVLEQLINMKLAKAEIKRLGIKVTDEEVDKAIDRVKRDNALTQEQLQARLEQDGTSLEELRKRFKDDIERAKLIDREVRARTVIPEEDIRKYYEEHQEDFTGKNRVRLKNILIPVAAGDDAATVNTKKLMAEQIYGKLQGGANFESLAREYSKGPNASRGGDLGYINYSDLAPFLSEAIENLQVGQASEVIETPYGLQIIQLAEKETTGIKPYEQVKDEIRDMLYREQINQKYDAWVEGLREKAYIKVTF